MTAAKTHDATLEWRTVPRRVKRGGTRRRGMVRQVRYVCCTSGTTKWAMHEKIARTLRDRHLRAVAR